MRKELYEAIKASVSSLRADATGAFYMLPDDMDSDLDIDKNVFKHIDLWNQNVEFIEQDAPWERPALFIEFCPIRWNTIVPGVQYAAEPQIRFHIVSDWVEDTEMDSLALRLPDALHLSIAGLSGMSFRDFTLAESHTNHNHEDIIESIEVYSFAAFMNIKQND